MSADRWDADRTSHALDISRSYLFRLAREGIIPKPIKGGWDIFECARLYIAKLIAAEPASRDDKTRKLKAEADIAEQKAARMASQLCRTADYYGDWQAGIAQAVKRISKLRCLAPAQRQQVIAELQGIELAPLTP